MLVGCRPEAPRGRGCGARAEETAFVFDSAGDRIDNDGDGYTEEQGDCDDNNCRVNPDGVDQNDGVDANCDGIRPPLYGCGVTTYGAFVPLVIGASTTRHRAKGDA